MQLDI